MISTIRLQNFRSYLDATFEFGSGVNIIVGPNGSGKTNLLESLQVISIGGSYRVRDVDLIFFNETWLRLDAVEGVGDFNRTLKLQSEPSASKTIEINSKNHKRLSLAQKLPLVLFEPNDLSLLHGSPEGRRNYIDGIIEQTVNGYGTFLRQYKRVLSQRNALLKKGVTSSVQFFPWNLRLSELGAVITRYRHDLVSDLNKLIASRYKDLSGSQKVITIEYNPGFIIDQYESSFFGYLESGIKNDADRGFTGRGPHREDIVFLMDGRPVSEVSSRGEVRTIVLALKTLELEIIEEERNKTPLLLLDDVFSELDGTRRRMLTNYLQRYQTFLTTTDADVVIKHLADSTVIPL